MSADKLKNALDPEKWTTNCNWLLLQAEALDRIHQPCSRLGIWAAQLEPADKGNPALCFVRAMQIEGHHVAALLSLALYKPALSCARTMVECALYYSYFRTHPVELGTLASKSAFYLDRTEITRFHKNHTPRFAATESALGLLSRLDDWYKRVSAIVHGQIPGGWYLYSGLSEIRHDPDTLERAIHEFERGEQIIHGLLLCTVAPDLWADFAVTAKRKLLKGLSAAEKAALTLTPA